MNKKIDKILDIVAALLALAILCGVVVGLVMYGGEPLRDLPSWVWFCAVVLLTGGMRRKQ